jgi:hypothetical protein
MNKPSVICLTPVKNEAWILHRFLKCASLWADYIIMADQNSTDGTREIIAEYPKAILVENKSLSFNEPERQKLLLEEARKIPGKKLLIAIDADEILSATIFNKNEWQTVLNAEPGTLIYFQWANFCPDMQTYWNPNCSLPVGYMDDGQNHSGEIIHSPRIPVPKGAPGIFLNEIKILHYQYADWARMESKHRWYQCWERLNRSNRRAYDIYRQYHHMYSTPKSSLDVIPESWLQAYLDKGIDMTSVSRPGAYWWDIEVLKLLEKHGTQTFKKENIWKASWKDIASSLDYPKPEKYADPRSLFDKVIHKWLSKTQSMQRRIDVYVIQAALKLIGW